jgi:hypothetical protein
MIYQFIILFFLQDIIHLIIIILIFVELVVSNPIVTYKETIISSSNRICLSKSPNKHNQLFISAEPLSEDLNCGLANRIVLFLIIMI